MSEQTVYVDVPPATDLEADDDDETTGAEEATEDVSEDTEHAALGDLFEDESEPVGKTFLE